MRNPSLAIWSRLEHNDRDRALGHLLLAETNCPRHYWECEVVSSVLGAWHWFEPLASPKMGTACDSASLALARLQQHERGREEKRG